MSFQFLTGVRLTQVLNPPLPQDSGTTYVPVDGLILILRFYG